MPTPFAVKMALISNCIDRYSIERAKELFKEIKDKKITYKLPKEIITNKVFSKITSFNSRSLNKLGNMGTISKPSFREYVYMKGSFNIALEISAIEEDTLKLIKELFININHFGKKGSFMQFKSFDKLNELGNRYCKTLAESNDISNAILQTTEDIPPKATFEHINIYNSKKRLKRENNKVIYIIKVEDNKAGDYFQYYKLK